MHINYVHFAVAAGSERETQYAMVSYAYGHLYKHPWLGPDAIGELNIACRGHS